MLDSNLNLDHILDQGNKILLHMVNHLLIQLLEYKDQEEG